MVIRGIKALSTEDTMKKIALDHERIIRLSGQLDEEVATDVLIVAERFLEKDSPSAPVQLIINSRGGDVSAAISLYNGLKRFPFVLYTVAEGQVASSAVIVYLVGVKRAITADSTILIHKPSGHLEGSYSWEEMALLMSDIKNGEDFFIKTIAKKTGQTKERVTEDIRTGRLFNAKEAVEYGFADFII